MAKTLEQLLSLSSIIANETKAGANTALRVGGLFSDIIYYLRDLDYADKEDIPSLEGYATEQWVLGKGYATTSDLDDRINALVNGAPQAYDTLKEIADVLAGNVNSISDILTALGNKADKATTLSGYGITDAYTIAQIDNIINVLSGNISTLQGYFTDGVANSALRLSDNGSYTAWGQTFFTNGKPKSLSGALTDVTDIASSGTITTNKIVIGNGTIEWDEANKGFKVTGLYSTTFLSAKGANTNGGSTPSGNQYTRLDSWDGYTSAMDGWVLSAKLGKGLYDTQNSLISRVGALEGKATNVSFTQSLTSGTQIGSISIDGVAKNIYAPTIPTNLSQFTDDVVSGKYLPLSGGTLSGQLTISANNTDVLVLNSLIGDSTATGGTYIKINYKGSKVAEIGHGWGLGTYMMANGNTIRITDNGIGYVNNDTIIHSGNYTDYAYSKTTIDSKFSGLGTFAYKSSLAFADLTDKPTTLGGYGITDWSVTFGDYDVNRRYDAGYYIITNGSNAPTHANYGSLLVMPYRKASGNTIPDFGTQIFLPNGDDSGYPNDMFFRTSLGSSWNAWQRVLTDNNYTYYTYSQSTIDTKLSGYLPLSGGTITGNLIVGGILNTSSHLRLQNHHLFVRNNEYADWIVTDKDWQHEYAIIHSGNIGSQSVAYATSAGGADVITKTYANENINYSRYESKIRLIRCNTNADTAVSLGYPSISYVSGLSVLTDYTGWQMVSYGAPSGLPNPYYRAVGDDGVWTDWRKLAFIDDNVASATKLQTARSIWGQSFDGTGNVSGDLHLNTSKIYWWGDAANYCISSVARENSSPYLNIAHYGGISFNTSGYERMYIAGSGNVLIGTTTDSGYKLDVGGNFRATRLRTNNICLECVMDGSESGCSSEINNFNSLLYMQFHSSLGISMCYGGGNVGIGNANPQYKLDVNGTLHASGAVTFDSALAVGGAARIDGNVAIGSGSDGNKLYVYGVVRSAAYNAIGNNNAAFVFDKPGSNYTGIGAKGVADTIYFGACSTTGAWVTDYYQKWHFNGEVYAATGIWSDGYVSAKGQNTSSDMRLKNVLNYVVLGVKDIANAPSMRFAWKNGGGVDVGSSAQYWQKLLPDAVKERDGMLEMQYANIALLSAIALAKNVETHEERIARLEKENKELRNEIKCLKYGA